MREDRKVIRHHLLSVGRGAFISAMRRLTSGGIARPFVSVKAGALFNAGAPVSVDELPAPTCAGALPLLIARFSIRPATTLPAGTNRNGSARTSGTTIMNSPSVVIMLPAANRLYKTSARKPPAVTRQSRFKRVSSRFIGESIVVVMPVTGQPLCDYQATEAIKFLSLWERLGEGFSSVAPPLTPTLLQREREYNPQCFFAGAFCARSDSSS